MVTKLNSGTKRLANLRVVFSTTSWLVWFHLFIDFPKFINLDYDVDDNYSFPYDGLKVLNFVIEPPL